MNTTKIKVIFLIVLMVAATFLFSVEEKVDTETVMVLGDGCRDSVTGYFICFCYMGSNCGCVLFGGGTGPLPDMRG